MDWLEDEPESCKDICSETCESREERVCDKLTGEDHLLKLLHDWGYEDILPPHQYHPVPLSTVAHIITGVIILVAGNDVCNIFLALHTILHQVELVEHLRFHY